jgi:hypothetical protein
MPNAFGWSAQWVAMPNALRGTRRAFFVNAVADAEPVLNQWITREAFNEFRDRRDNALSKLRGMLAVAEVGSLCPIERKARPP